MWHPPGTATASAGLGALRFRERLAYSGWERRGRLPVVAEAVAARLDRLAAGARGGRWHLDAVAVKRSGSSNPTAALAAVMAPVFTRVRGVAWVWGGGAIG